MRYSYEFKEDPFDDLAIILPEEISIFLYKIFQQ